MTSHFIAFVFKMHSFNTIQEKLYLGGLILAKRQLKRTLRWMLTTVMRTKTRFHNFVHLCTSMAPLVYVPAVDELADLFMSLETDKFHMQFENVQDYDESKDKKIVNRILEKSRANLKVKKVKRCGTRFSKDRPRPLRVSVKTAKKENKRGKKRDAIRNLVHAYSRPLLLAQGIQVKSLDGTEMEPDLEEQVSICFGVL